MSSKYFNKVLLAPNKAVGFDSEHLAGGFPYLASNKLDGMRAVAIDGTLYSRSMKELREGIQTHFQHFLKEAAKAGLVFDGELYAHDVGFGNVMSSLRRGGAEVHPEIKFHVFDVLSLAEWRFGAERPYADRISEYENWIQHYCERSSDCLVSPVRQTAVWAKGDLENRFQISLDAGYEGLMLRDPAGRYKHGRGTLREGLIYKFKEWVTVDAKIVGFKRSTRMKREYAESDRGVDELGRYKRTSSKDTREEYDGIGSIVLESSDGVVFAAGQAKECDFEITWDNKGEYLERWVEVRFMRHGAKDKPRFAGIVRLRDDLSDGDSIEGLKDIM